MVINYLILIALLWEKVIVFPVYDKFFMQNS